MPQDVHTSLFTSTEICFGYCNNVFRSCVTFSHIDCIINSIFVGLL